MRKRPADRCGLQCSYRSGLLRYRICGVSEKKRGRSWRRRPRRPRHPSALSSAAPGHRGAPDRPPPHNGRPLNQLSHRGQPPLRNNRSDENLTVSWRTHYREFIKYVATGSVSDRLMYCMGQRMRFSRRGRLTLVLAVAVSTLLVGCASRAPSGSSTATSYSPARFAAPGSYRPARVGRHGLRRSKTRGTAAPLYPRDRRPGYCGGSVISRQR